jgi:hypothetical protein
MLRSTLNTPEIRAEVDALEFEIPPMMTNHRRDEFYEHGQWWIRVEAWDDYDGTTAIFSVVDGPNGLEAEFVDGEDW